MKLQLCHLVLYYAYYHSTRPYMMTSVWCGLFTAHSASMMCSYGSFNGLPDCLHKDYITETIRNKWNWTGFVVSDWYVSSL